jgi:hypothetical protein
MNAMKVKIPTLLIDKVIDITNTDPLFYKLKEGQQQKLIKRLIELCR